MLASSSGNASLYGVQTWTFTDSRILAANSYAVAWGLTLTAPCAIVLTPTGTTLADGSLIAAIDFGVADCLALFATSKARRHGVLYLYDLTGKVELYRMPLALDWADEPAGWVAPTPSGDVAATLAQLAAAVATHAALTSSVHGITPAAATVLDDLTVAAMRATLEAEAALGNPSVTGQALVSTDAGVRSWSTVAALTDATPADLGTAAVGNGTTAARSNHVHNLPAAASTTAAGLAPQATAPAAGLRSVMAIDNGETARTDKALFDATNPAANGTSAPGSAMTAARRDHVHATDTTRGRYATANAVGDVSGSVTADFATSLTNTYTLTGNCTALLAPTNLADGETGAAYFTIGAYSMPSGPASGCFKGAWTVTGTVVRVIWERVGAVYYVSADSLTVVA